MTKGNSLGQFCTPTQRIIFLVLLLIGIGFRIRALLATNYESLLEISVQGNVIATILMGVTLFKTNIHDFYVSGAYATMIIVASAALVLPVVRYSVLTWAFFFRTKRTKLRSKILFGIDIFGRIMMGEFFGVMINTVFFKLDLSLVRDRVGINMAIYFFDAYYMGNISNILATVLTQYLLHVGLQNEPSPVIIEKNEERVPLYRRIAHGKTIVFIHWLAPIMMLCMIHLLVFRAQIMNFTLSGLVGSVLPKYKSFDLFTSVFEFQDSIRSGESFGGHFSTALLFFVVVLMPVLATMTWFVLIYIPLSLRHQRMLLYIIPFFFSFVGLEVFTLVAISNVYENGLVASFLFTDKAPEMCALLERHGLGKCADVEGEFDQAGMFSLIVWVSCLACVQIYWLRKISNDAAFHIVNEAEEEESKTEAMLSQILLDEEEENQHNMDFRA